MLLSVAKFFIKRYRPVAYALCILLCLQLISSTSQAQVVWETHTSEVYNYLSRMAQKGMIRFDDNIRPLSRKYIADCLDSLRSRTGSLSPIEKQELSFYEKEYGNELLPSDDSTGQVHFLKKDAYKRWRSFSVSGNGFLLQAEPVFTAATFRGSSKSVNQSSSGLHFWGYAGKHWGFQFFYNDITESGKGFDSTRQNTPETGIVRKDTSLHTGQNFSLFRGSISYSWKNGSLSFGQEHLLWGYGQSGKIVLSDKAPAFPFIRLDYRPLSWLSFNYTHTWLNSLIIDSARTYPTGSGGVFDGTREMYIPKFMATHSIQVKASKGLDLTAGESIVYSDRLDVGYLFPLMFFKIYDNIVNNSNIRAGSNGQLFFQISSRNQLPKTHLYTTVFIDEIRVSAIFDRKNSRNQVGFTMGGSITDMPIPYMTLGIEYTRVNPFVYRNLLPAQDYTSYNYYLGDWMGNNFDRISYSLKYTPFARFKCQLNYQSSRKGGPGTIAQQYFSQPQPAFLFDLQNKQQEFVARFTYEVINNLQLNAFYSSLTTDNRVTLQKTSAQTFSVGFSYGL